jgi:hypothetical protein
MAEFVTQFWTFLYIIVRKEFQNGDQKSQNSQCSFIHMFNVHRGTFLIRKAGVENNKNR